MQLKGNSFYNRYVKRFAAPIIVLLLAIAAGVAYFFLTPDPMNKQATVTSNTQTQAPAQPSPKPKNAIEAITAYAAMQFNVKVEEVKILSSEKQEWNDICLGIKIKNYACDKKKISGSEATVLARGIKTVYRSTEDGSIIRIVK